MISDVAVTVMAPFIALLVYVFAFYIGYLVVKAAVRSGVSAALGLSEEVSLKDVIKASIADALAERDADMSATAPASVTSEPPAE